MTTRYGKKEVIKYGVITVLTILLCMVLSKILWNGFVWLAVVPIIEYLFVLYFFRDPQREVIINLDHILSPADGVVTHIEECDDIEYLGGKALRISIFLSVFNVHINRASYPGVVKHIEYKKGEFLNAMNKDSLHLNECNDVGFETTNPKMSKYMLRQIVGLIARRIVCGVEVGDTLEQGEQYGMMKFGSRTDVYIPISTEVTVDVKVGDKVEAGISVLANIK